MHLISEKDFSLRSLKYVLSTGSPLKPTSFDYIYNSVKSDVIVGSISGNPVRNKRGELVCLKLFPSMPTHFLGDPDGAKYKKAYFSRFPNVWTHGDFCAFNELTRGIIMLGRSDGTLNPGGVRFGSSELYNIVEKYPGIADSLVVGQPLPSGDERVVLFVKLDDDSSSKPAAPMTSSSSSDPRTGFPTSGGAPSSTAGMGSVDAVDDESSSKAGSGPTGSFHVADTAGGKPGLGLTEEFVKGLKTHIRTQLSARHVPSLVLAVPDIPHTHSGKKVEVAVKRILSGESVLNAASIANADCLRHFRDIPQLRIDTL